MRTRQTILILLIAFALGVFAAKLPSSVAQFGTPDGSGYSFMDPIIEVFDTIDRSYVDQPDDTKLQTGAINGMLETLDDPYTQYIPPAERATFQKEMTQQFVGIGAEVKIEGGYLTIASPLEDSPAYNAGIKPNDRIIEIEGESTLNMPIDKCIEKLTGVAGTDVHIVVERGGAGGQKIPMTITRQHIIVRAVKGLYRKSAAPAANADEQHAPPWEYMIDPDKRIAYMRLTQFTPTAAKELAAALEAVHATEPADQGGLGGLILDLRGDPGGVLDTALAIADFFLKDGVICSVKGRGVPDEVHKAHDAGTLPDFPIEILVNGQSASASEILSGALSDHNRAVIIGSRTFGKGLVQAVQTLRYGKGAQLKFTQQRYYLPSGRLIQRTDQATTWGVDPTPGFYIPMTEQEQIARLTERRDLDVLQARGDTGAPAQDAAAEAPKDSKEPGATDQPAKDKAAKPKEPPRWSDPAWIESTLKDKQLAAALTAMRTRMQTGEWKPVSDAVEQPDKVSMSELHQLQVGRERVLRELARVERRIETLESVAAGDAKNKPTPPDLWPDTVNVVGGHVDVFDKDGRKVTTLNITGPNLERWLIDADVKPADAPAGASDASGGAAPKDNGVAPKPQPSPPTPDKNAPDKK